MAKAEMNAFDVAALVHELQPLVGSRVDKVFQPAPGEVLVRLRTKASEDQGTKRDLWILVGKAVTLTRTARENPTEPPSFSMQLRRQLSGGRVAAVRQHHFDRVLEVDIERAEGGFTLVVELFHDGNVILVREGRILAALLQQSWATREVRPGAEFRHPPPRTMPSSLTYDEFRARLLASDADAVRTLATEFNLGGSYAEEVCALADVPKNTPTRELLEAQARALHDGIGRLVGRLERGELDPVVVWKDAARVDVAPWPLRAHDKPELRLERKATFAEALDTFYAAPGAPAAREDPAMKRFREEKGKAERQHAAQKAGLEKFEKEEAEARVKGDLLYGSFQEAQAAIAYVAALGRSLGWKDALARLVAA
ncbi:MAG TPA: NFACT family protein, partial [Candidatus Thermoplasmatota archaeon]|nr:NFACT family protein [Candidatus Thermoplasmatota archaeon]